MFSDAFRYPVGGRRWFDRVAIGGGLHLLAVFVPVIPLVFVVGYLVRVLRETVVDGPTAFDRTRERPRFRPVGQLLRDGVVACAIALAFLSVPILVLVVTVLVTASGGVDPTSASDAIAFQVGGTVTLLLALAFAYPVPAAVAGYAVGGVHNAFDRTTLHRAITDGGYFYVVTVGIVVLALAIATYDTLNRLALGFFVAFYLEVVVVALWGRSLHSVIRIRE
jgi:hypothetical protein